MTSYKDAGVDIEKGDTLVKSIQERVKNTYGPRVVSGVGGFACLYQMGQEKLLAAGTDGVGTKLMLAHKLGIHNTVGIDLVAMCVNDVLCTGARPLFFMDYLATGKLDVQTGESIIEGIVTGCEQGEMALIGGETAEMPGMYPDGEYDLAGFAVGEVDKSKLVDGNAIKSGDTIFGIASNGFHSNGFSLIRKHVRDDEIELQKELLTPTRIYWKSLKEILQHESTKITGLAHITGGGLDNIGRLNDKHDYILDTIPTAGERTEAMNTILERTQLSQKELAKVFNMGVGMAIITSTPEIVAKLLESQNEKYWKLGTVVNGDGQVLFNFD